MTSSEQVDVLDGMLAMPLRQLERVQHWAPRIRVIAAVSTALIYIITWLIASYDLWQDVASGAFSAFWSAYGTHILYGVTLIHISSYVWAFLGTADEALALHRAVVAGDDRVAPVDPDQPIALTGSELPLGAQRITPLARLERSSARPRRSAGLFSLVMSLALAIATVVLFTLRGPAGDLGQLLAIIALILGVLAIPFFAAAGILLLMLARRSLRPLVVTADEWGAAWTTATVPYRRLQIAWHEARAFFRTTPILSAEANIMTIYVLDAGDTVLAWALSPSVTPEEHAASERLCRLIVTRTRLPLRSVAPDSLHPMPKSDELASERKLPDPASVPTAPVSAWRVLLLNPSCLGVLAVLALSGLLGLAGLVLQRIQ